MIVLRWNCLERKALGACFALLLAATIGRAGTITGSVRNGTTGTAAAGVEVILIQLQGGMQEVATTKTDAQGRYQFDRPEIVGAPMLIRVPYRGVNYHEPVPPGKNAADVQIFEPTDKPESVVVTTHAIVLQPAGSELLVGEEYAVENKSHPPVAFYREVGTFTFTLPSGAHLNQVSAWGGSGMPVVQGTLDKGKGRSAIAYAFKPGTNGVRMSYQLSYPDNRATFKAVSFYPAERMLLVAPPQLQVSGEGFQPAGSEQGFSVYERDQVAANTPISLTVSGTAPMAQQGAGGGADSDSQNPSINSRAEAGADTAVTATALPARLDGVKWILVAGFIALFALGFAFVWRRPQVASASDVDGVASARTPPKSSLGGLDRAVHGSLDELKDQLFRLELRHQAGTISEDDYARERKRMEKVLRDLVKG